MPVSDWPAVSRGKKTEFRANSGRVSGLLWVEPPTPVVVYTVHRTRGYQAKLMVLEARWQEELASISPESLAREGFETLEQFRRYWMTRERRRFKPLHIVTAYRVRPFTPDDRREFAAKLLDHLYGEWL